MPPRLDPGARGTDGSLHLARAGLESSPAPLARETGLLARRSQGRVNDTSHRDQNSRAKEDRSR